MSNAWISPALLTAMRASMQVLARMDVGDERFEPVGDEFHRPSEHDRGRSRGDLVAEGVDLQPERAADVRRHDPHVVLGHPERAREHGLDHVRHLAAGMDRQALRSTCRNRRRSARGSRLTAVCRPKLNVPSTTTSAAAKAASTPPVSTTLRNARLSPSSACSTGVPGSSAVSLCGDDRAAPPTRSSTSSQASSASARVSRHHHHHRLAVPAGAIDGHRILRRRLHAGEAGQCADPRARAHLGELGPGHHLDDARRARGGAGIDAHDARMRMGAAHERGVHHARQRDVVGVGAASGHRAPRADARQRARPT